MFYYLSETLDGRRYAVMSARTDSIVAVYDRADLAEAQKAVTLANECAEDIQAFGVRYAAALEELAELNGGRA